MIGIYALFEKEICIYVGASLDTDRRIKNHPHRKQADRIETFPCGRAELVKLEQAKIDELHPLRNKARARSVFKVRHDIFSFAFTPEEMKMLAKIKRQLAPTLGKVTNITAIRWALREVTK